HRHRHGDLNIVAHARKHRMRAGAHNQEQVSGRSAVHARVALALQPDSLPIARSRLDAKLHSLGPAYRAFAVAGGAGIRNAPGAIAARAGNVEFHPTAHLRHLARAIALGTRDHATRDGLAVAGGADLLAMNLNLRLAAANRRPKVHRRLILKIGARLRSARLLRLMRSRKDAGKNIFEAAPCRGTGARLRAGPARKSRKIEALEVHWRAPSTACRLLPRIRLRLRRIDLVGIEAELVVNLPLLLVTQNVVGLGDLLELLFGLLIAGIHVGMVFARSLPERLADLVLRGRLLHAKSGVIIFVGRCWHLLLTLSLLLAEEIEIPHSTGLEPGLSSRSA